MSEVPTALRILVFVSSPSSLSKFSIWLSAIIGDHFSGAATMLKTELANLAERRPAIPARVLAFWETYELSVSCGPWKYVSESSRCSHTTQSLGSALPVHLRIVYHPRQCGGHESRGNMMDLISACTCDCCRHMSHFQ